ncbi:DEAD/DEAH box helicase [Rhodococcus sp. IEGM 1307]|uniref:DEAD/DEAH box helicase n=1 Tax=Rhodococcus sp. IEGM 1307 TaxID=3047091 RepID=UPI0024B6EECF|nr:DEAD/DEAH box helicase [Rhodococcus sp. IEGM 1307]MDI9976165.1 DEAD/DEAH box helicase [Rhodococcus sp. IEGM 1307]
MTAGPILAACAATFVPSDPPRDSRLAFWRDSPDGPLPPSIDSHTRMAIGSTVERVPTQSVSLADALPMLLALRPGETTHRSVAFWAACTRTALGYVGAGKVLPAVTPGGRDSWRLGVLDDEDESHLRLLAAALPPEARAIPLGDPSAAGVRLPAAADVLRDFLTAAVDTIPRLVSPADDGPYLGWNAEASPELRAWADALAPDAIALSLRIDPVDPGKGDLSDSEFDATVQVHGLARPGVVCDAVDLWRHPTLAESAFASDPRIAVLDALRRAAQDWAPLEDLLRAEAPHRIRLADDDLASLAGDAGRRLRERGVEIHWPRELVARTSTRMILGEPGSREGAAAFGGDRAFDFDWRIAVGDDVLTREEMEELVSAERAVVKLRNRYVVADSALIRKTLQRRTGTMTSIEALRASLTGRARRGEEDVRVDSYGAAAAVARELSDQDPEAVPAPAALRAQLRDYQLTGFRWLAGLTSRGLGACLADDMGLGKTLTLIALHLHRQQTPETAGPTLVVCPASLLGNWRREIERFAPGTGVLVHHGPKRRPPGETVTPGGDIVVLTTYATMRLDGDVLARTVWGLVVADEAQHLKNRAASVTRALRTIPGLARVALTGTPVENRLSDLWSILDGVTPGLLGPYAQFRRRYDGSAAEDGIDRAAELAALISPFVLRRTKSDPGIAPELPPKTEIDLDVTLTPEQAGMYEALVREAMEQIETSDGIGRRGSIVSLLTGLKQICNHPAQYLGEEHAALTGRSHKIGLLDELVDTNLSEGGRSLVFTHFTAMGRLLRRHLTTRGVGCEFLHGGTSVAAREELVQRFQNGDIPVLILSLKAAGTGLNLTRADHVVHFDRWWNPAVEDQATDRAYRIGQTHPVVVHRLVTAGTIEERIAGMLASKRQLANSVLSHGADAFTELTDRELTRLVALSPDYDFGGDL